MAKKKAVIPETDLQILLVTGGGFIPGFCVLKDDSCPGPENCLKSKCSKELYDKFKTAHSLIHPSAEDTRHLIWATAAAYKKGCGCGG